MLLSFESELFETVKCIFGKSDSHLLQDLVVSGLAYSEAFNSVTPSVKCILLCSQHELSKHFSAFPFSCRSHRLSLRSILLELLNIVILQLLSSLFHLHDHLPLLPRLLLHRILLPMQESIKQPLSIHFKDPVFYLRIHLGMITDSMLLPVLEVRIQPLSYHVSYYIS